MDTTGPSVTNCPNDIAESTELGTNGTNVTWTEPSASDLSGIPRRFQSHIPSTMFIIGDTNVTYTFVDTSDNTAMCSFTVTVYTGK